MGEGEERGLTRLSGCLSEAGELGRAPWFVGSINSFSLNSALLFIIYPTSFISILWVIEQN